MLRTSVCLLAGARLGAAQGSLSEDVAVLLAFKAHGNNAQADGLDTWVVEGDPCGAGFDDPSSGFARVMCCDAYSSDYDHDIHQSIRVCTGSRRGVITGIRALCPLSPSQFMDNPRATGSPARVENSR